ncbi:SulP family inorganic anion transporter [Leucobacter viscericola]|uniref:SulP family inorganic anion transporter n=1 Tax=Leucobacter viscericola TaxID=2714935 RepID=A0A6G7XC75_9MICO|nr:SulP family inorganic anion transporter [Leucobacter viscericola]QIK62049.1 SulP family inorganic anion transporter [Leucobacter viscericola]
MKFRVLPGLHRNNVAQEALSGVTLLAIAVPLNIGYAQIAGLPATAGLYSLILPCIVFALIASTRQLIVSPDAAAAALVAASLGGLATAGDKDYIQLAMAQAIIGAVLFGLCAVFKLGFLANFLSEPILVGFVGGLALDILLSQVAKMLGVHVNSGDEFIPRVGELFAGLGTTNGWSLLISVLAIMVLVGGRRLARLVPWALIVLIVGTVAVVLTNAESAGVAVLGAVEAGPPAITWPQITSTQWLQVTPSAFALTLVAVAEGLLVARRYGQKHGYTTSPNRDLAAFGAANFAAGVSGGFTIGSSTSRTAALDDAGSRTQLPAIVAALGTLLLVLFGTALLEHIPSAAIGAIVAVAVLPLLGIKDLISLWRERKFEFAVAVICFLGTLLLGPIIGIMLAFVLSLINLARRAASPRIDLLTEAESGGITATPLTPEASNGGSNVAVVRFAAPVFFANAGVLSDQLTSLILAGSANGLRHLVLDCEAITDIDVTGAKALREVESIAATAKITLHLSRVRPEIASAFSDFGLFDGASTFVTNEQAIRTLTPSSP